VTRRGVLLSLLMLSAAHAEVAAPTFDEALSALGFGADAKARILKGEILSKDLAEGSDKELAAVLAFRVRAPLAQLLEAARSGKTLAVDSDILGLGKAPTEFDQLGYTPAEAGEAYAVLNVAPGSKFNFSKAEIERWQALKAKLKGADPRKDAAALAAVNAQYRAILADRLAAYQKGGLPAIAPYTRGKTEAKPGEELAIAEKGSLAGKAFPEFQKALAGYPTANQTGLEHDYLWIKQRVEGRPILILTHRMYLQGKDYIVGAQRQIYVGASYNSQQSITGGREEGGLVLAIYGNRCSTDQVAGMGSGMKHGIGRGQMVGELKSHFENVRKLLEK
jgi:hypothetical protein